MIAPKNMALRMIPADPRHAARLSRGFNLLELLIAMAIISILAVVGIPAFLDYQIRAKVSEGITLSQPARAFVAEYYLTMGTWPRNNTQAGLAAPRDYASEYVEKIEVKGKRNKVEIEITYNIPALGKKDTLVYSPADPASAAVRWRCDQGSLADKYRPAACRKD